MDWNNPDDLELHHSYLLSGIRDTAQEKVPVFAWLTLPLLAGIHLRILSETCWLDFPRPSITIFVSKLLAVHVLKERR